MNLAGPAVDIMSMQIISKLAISRLNGHAKDYYLAPSDPSL